MHYIEVDDQRVKLDADGYLAKAGDWTPGVAERFARLESLVLGDAHWEVINMLRRFYNGHQIVPSMRPLVKLTTRELGPEKGNSIYLLGLFPGNPALLASRIAGLPRPENCF